MSIRQKVLCEDHKRTADRQHKLEVAQFMLKDYTSGTDSLKRALNIRQNILCEDHKKTANWHYKLGVT